MALRTYQIKQLANVLDELLVGGNISHLIQISESAFSFHFSKGGRLVFDLDNADPSLYLSRSIGEMPTLNSLFSTTLRKEVSNAFVLSVSTVNSDRIIDIELECTNQIFEKVTRHLIAELLPSKTNLILVDENNVVLGSMKTKPLGEPRPVFRGIAYTAPEKNDFVSSIQEQPFNFNSYCEEREEKESKLLEKRKKDRFSKLYKYAETKLKGAKKKIKAISNDLVLAKEHMNDGQYGDFIYMNMDSIDLSKGMMDYYGEEVALDKSKSLVKNAEAFYKRQKKSKSTYKMGEENLEKAKKELKDAELLSEICKSADEDVLGDLMNELGLAKEIRQSKKNQKKDTILSKESYPYVVKDGNTVYLFGKSARQNDFLTFAYATAKKHTWMHLNAHTGCHLVIRKEDASNDELLLGAELCCLCSKLSDGEVMYCLRKDVRKGNVPGQAIVPQYKTIYIKNISKKAKDLFASASKLD
ncbi:MAG: NFACT family protein [Bacilli bacterium]|nr:NFACT family protein [Bacilli bacterium]